MADYIWVGRGGGGGKGTNAFVGGEHGRVTFCRCPESLTSVNPRRFALVVLDARPAMVIADLAAPVDRWAEITGHRDVTSRAEFDELTGIAAAVRSMRADWGWDDRMGVKDGEGDHG